MTSQSDRAIPELRALGKLGFSTKGHPWDPNQRRSTIHGVSEHDQFGLELIDQVVSFLRQALSHESLGLLVKDFLAARRTFQVLVDVGYPHQRYLFDLELFIIEVERQVRRQLVRALLLGTDEEAEKCLRVLERGRWRNWRAEFQEVEDEVCADIEAGRTRQKIG